MLLYVCTKYQEQIGYYHTRTKKWSLDIIFLEIERVCQLP